MLVVARLLIVGLVSSTMAFTTTDFLKDAVKGTWDMAPPNGATIFLCSQEQGYDPDGHRSSIKRCLGCRFIKELQNKQEINRKDPHDMKVILKDLSRLGFTVKMAQPRHWFDTLESARQASPQGLHTLVVDWQCSMAHQLLHKAGKLAVVRNPFRWLVLNVTEEEQTEESCQNLAAEISANGLNESKATDADVVLVCRGQRSLILVDFWGHSSSTVLGKWSPHSKHRFQSNQQPPAVRRMDTGLNGYVFRTAFTITNNDTYKHLDDGVNKQYDFMTKFNYEVCYVITKMLNATVEEIYTKDWGYKINGTWNGLVGLQDRREAELGGTPTAMLLPRLEVQNFLNFQTPAVTCFIFREPPMSYIYNLFTRPFPAKLWLATIGLISLGAVLLLGVLHAEESTGVEELQIVRNMEKGASKGSPQMAEGRKRKLVASWGNVALLFLGAVCQQGSPTEPRGYSGRIATLFLFFAILFLYTAYTASIVALLQSTTSDIQHYKDFLDSKIELGIQNVSYNVYYIKNFNDTIRRRVYLEKLIKEGRRNPFMTLEEGMTKVRKSYFAFMALRPNLYQTISDTWREHEKCGLREVENFLGVVANPHLSVAKWSTHAEVLRIALRKVHERGIRQRQVQRFMPFKPLCMSNTGNFHSVSLTDCYAPLVVLGSGLGVSLFIFVVENLFFFMNERLKLKRQRKPRRNAMY